MSIRKTILRSHLVHVLVSFLLAFYIRLVYVTSRKILQMPDAAAPFMRGEKNAIFAFWHGRMMMLPVFCPQGRLMHVLISHHRDGRLISSVIRYFHHKTIAGSSSRGGRKAMIELMRTLESGDNISITPDGPRGPVGVASSGVVALARFSKKPILPITFSSSRGIYLRSWDRFLVALPFGRIAFCVGEPIELPAEKQDDETARQQIETAMNQLTQQADGIFGV